MTNEVRFAVAVHVSSDQGHGRVGLSNKGVGEATGERPIAVAEKDVQRILVEANGCDVHFPVAIEVASGNPPSIKRSRCHPTEKVPVESLRRTNVARHKIGKAKHGSDRDLPCSHRLLHASTGRRGAESPGATLIGTSG